MGRRPLQAGGLRGLSHLVECRQGLALAPGGGENQRGDLIGRLRLGFGDDPVEPGGIVRGTLDRRQDHPVLVVQAGGFDILPVEPRLEPGGILLSTARRPLGQGGGDRFDELKVRGGDLTGNIRHLGYSTWLVDTRAVARLGCRQA